MDKVLSPLWFFSQGPIDFEYKKYILLDYLQYVDSLYEQKMLYPILDEIKYHYKNLESFRTTRELILNKSKKLIVFDFNNLTLLYDMADESSEFKIINNIVNYSEQKLKDYYNKGKLIFREIDNNIKLQYIGIRPETSNSGFLILNIDKNIHIYKFEKPIINLENEYKVLLDEIDIQRINLYNSYDNIKYELLNNFKLYSNPAVLAANIFKTYPLEEAIIPVMKCKLAVYLK